MGVGPFVASDDFQAGAAVGVAPRVAVTGELQDALGDAGRAYPEMGVVVRGQDCQQGGMARCARVDKDPGRGCVGGCALKDEHGFWLAVTREIPENWLEHAVGDAVPLRAAVVQGDGDGLSSVAGEGVGEVAPIDILQRCSRNGGGFLENVLVRHAGEELVARGQQGE